MRAKTLRAVLAAVGLLLLAAPGTALSLDEAKAKGLVGERVDGFVGIVVADPSADVRALVDDVNARRRRSYGEIARSNGTSLDAVAALAGQKLVDRAPSGQWVAGASGTWRRK